MEKSKLDKDKEGKAIDPSHYRGMIGTLLYLTASRPDSICYMHVCLGTIGIRRILQICSICIADADHAGCQDTRRSTSGSMQFLGDRLVRWSSKRQKRAAISSTEAEILLFRDVVLKSHELANIFTKALAREIIEFLINKLGMQSFTPETLKQLADEIDE
ncbi:hypothetical protein Tco_1327406 [Tanacetum coccineum]